MKNSARIHLPFACLAAGLVLLLAACVTAPVSSRQSELAKLMARGRSGYILVDVRSPEEYAAGHIPTAINIPLGDLPLKMPAASEGQNVFTYCNTGIMAGVAADKLKAAGYAKVESGAIGDWKGKLETGVGTE